MYRIPRWLRRFQRNLLRQDLIAGRKVVMATTDDEGIRHYHIEAVPNPISPLTNPVERDRMGESIDNQTSTT